MAKKIEVRCSSAYRHKVCKGADCGHRTNHIKEASCNENCYGDCGQKLNVRCTPRSVVNKKKLKIFKFLCPRKVLKALINGLRQK